MQGSADAWAALAWRTNLALGAVLLLTLGRGPGGVIRGLRRTGQFIEPCLKHRDACVLRGDTLVRGGKLPQQRQDQRVLLGVAQPGEIGGGITLTVRIDSAVTVSSRIPSGRADRRPPKRPSLGASPS